MKKKRTHFSVDAPSVNPAGAALVAALAELIAEARWREMMPDVLGESETEKHYEDLPPTGSDTDGHRVRQSHVR